METAATSDDKPSEPSVHQPHILTGIVEDDGAPGAPKEPSSPPPSSPPIEEGDGKYVCKLERKKSSIRRKRVLTAVTSADNKPVHIPLVEYGDRHDVYEQIAERVMRGHDVTLGMRTLKEKLGMLTAIRDSCTQKIDARLAREARVRRRVHMKRCLVLWTFGFLGLSVLVVLLKVLFIGAKAYYGLIKDHIHHFRAT